ncbi:hypothetical protein O0L34_g12648 [Tuta absoluta]|nr:hypothetical protein O0L34_g12648 [Tuta absoluta]
MAPPSHFSYSKTYIALLARRCSSCSRLPSAEEQRLRERALRASPSRSPRSRQRAISDSRHSMAPPSHFSYSKTYIALLARRCSSCSRLPSAEEQRLRERALRASPSRSPRSRQRAISDSRHSMAPPSHFSYSRLT